MAELTFRDFAGAVMRGDAGAATSVLQTLLGLPADAAQRATEHFRARMSDPSFMPKAMGLRAALTSGSDDDITSLLGDCFGLPPPQRATALAALRARYQAP
jgi:hypothetical protein